MLCIVLTVAELYAQQPTAQGVSSFEKRMETINRELSSLREDFMGAEGRYLSPLTMNREYTESPAKKLEKGDYYFQRKDYISSGGIYYSLFSTRKEKDFIWEEAIFKLAESLFLNNNYISAARYYEILLTDKPYSRFQVEALKRLISAAYYLGEYSKAKTYYSEFVSIGYDMTRDQDLVYFLGKSLFFDRQYDEAREIFQTIKKEGLYYPQSLYFLGVINIQLADIDKAIPLFKEVIDLPSSTSYFKYQAVRNLSILALGRLLFEKGDFTGATDYYLKLDRSSDLFAEAYFELCWAYIKREQFEKALEALRLIKYIAPGSIVVPQAELLEGNLLVKLRKYGDAMVLFNKIVKEYVDIREQLSTLEKSGRTVFDGEDSAENVQFSVYSPLVRSLLKDNKKFSHAVRLQDDLKGIELELEQVAKLENKLNTIIGNKNAAAIFPPLKEGTERVLSFQNRLLRLRDDLLTIRAELTLNALPEKEKNRYREIDKGKQELQKKLQELLPRSSQELEATVTRYAEQILALEEEIHRASLQMRSLHDQLDSIATYYLRSTTQSGNTDQRIVEKIEQEKSRVLKFLEQIIQFKQETESEKNHLLLGGDMFSQMIIARDSYNKIVSEQDALLKVAPMQSSLQREQFDQASASIEELSRKVEGFNAKLNEVIGGIIQNIRDSFESEKIKIEEYKSQLALLKRETNEAASLAMLSNITKVHNTFDELILQADLGIIDVAWEKKEEATQTLNKMRTRMALEIQELYLNLENLE